MLSYYIKVLAFNFWVFDISCIINLVITLRDRYLGSKYIRSETMIHMIRVMSRYISIFGHSSMINKIVETDPLWVSYRTISLVNTTFFIVVL